MPTILLLSGPIASGKTTLADALITAANFKRLKSSDHLKRLCEEQGREVSRLALQQLGDALDDQTDYRWLISDVAKPQIADDPRQDRWLIDSVRKEQQVRHFKDEFGAAVFHVHIWAPDDVLKRRFGERLNSSGHSEGLTSYVEAVSHPNEAAARSLKATAELSIELTSIQDAVDQILEVIARRG